MATAKYTEWILQTIDQLKIRKARPDMGRICHMAKRKHGLKYAETEAQLEKLVQEGTVVKVEFKGSISYRNASKTRKIRFGKVIKPSDEICDQIYDAIKDLSSDDSMERKGATIQDIEKWLLTNTREKSRILKSQLQEVLDKDAENGKLKKLSNGAYVLLTARKKKKKKFLANKQVTGSIGTLAAVGSSPGKRGRPPSKRKKFRKTHGPDFAESPIFPKKSASITDDVNVCDFCLNNEDCNSKGEKEALLTCKDCSATAHPSCMGYNDGLAKRALASPWQCIDCKTCYVCEDSGEGDMMLFCDSCDKGYHMSCHNPAITEKPIGKWVCGQCVLEGSADEMSIESDDLQDSMLDDDSQNMDGASCLPTPCDSPVSTEDDNFRKEEVVGKRKAEKRKRSGNNSNNILNIDGNNYPDASKWNVIDVVNFFTKKGFKEQAESFKEQEIDGQSLLLMKRMDVLTGLNIKLGPALKIYQHVMKLQTAGIDLDSLS